MALHILIVEDDVVNRRYLGELLLSQGHHCCLSGSLREARRVLQQHDFDLCLVDQQLPDGLGECLRDEAQTRLIMMSGDPPSDAADWLCKPIAAEALAKVLDGTLPAMPVTTRKVTALDLDDAAAALALGPGAAALAGLRRLLRAELIRESPQLELELGAARHAAVMSRMHRWKAASALCGAERLSGACVALEQALRSGADTGSARAALNEAVARLLVLLEGRGDG